MKDYFNSKMILFKNNLKKSDVIISSKINEFKKIKKNFLQKQVKD